MNDVGAYESTNMIEHDGRCLCSSRWLGGEQLNPSGEGINDNKYILVTMGIFGQWSYVIQMKNFKWIIGRTRKPMSLYRKTQSISKDIDEEIR